MDHEVNEGYENGELYVFKNGRFDHVNREDDEGMKRIRVTEPAYQRAQEIGRKIRRKFKGWRPDLTLIVSGLLLYAIDEDDMEEVEQSVRRIAKEMLDENPES